MMSDYSKDIARFKRRRAQRLMHRVSLAYRMDANSRLVYGLCKGAGIDTKGMNPEQAWKALAEKKGKDPSYYYAHAFKSIKVQVDGPKNTKKFIKGYVKKHPDIIKEAKEFKDARNNVRDFLKNHPDAENFKTYDVITGEKLENLSGVFVTFHQNLTADDTLGGYSDDDYAMMCAIAKRELNSDGVFIGYYGNPEISFNCHDLDIAMKFAVQHNQQSVYNSDTDETIMNVNWNPETNPIRLSED